MPSQATALGGAGHNPGNAGHTGTFGGYGFSLGDAIGNNDFGTPMGLADVVSMFSQTTGNAMAALGFNPMATGRDPTGSNGGTIGGYSPMANLFRNSGAMGMSGMAGQAAGNRNALAGLSRNMVNGVGAPGMAAEVLRNQGAPSPGIPSLNHPVLPAPTGPAAFLGSPGSPGSPAAPAAPFVYARPEEMPRPSMLPFGVGLTPIQERAAIASQNLGGNDVLGYYKNLALRSLIGDRNNIIEDATILPAERNYVSRFVGKTPGDESVKSFIDVLLGR